MPENHKTKIAIVFGSQRKNGTAQKIEERIIQLNLNHDYDFIRMSDMRIEGCVHCTNCSTTGKCALVPGDNDMFENIFNRLIESDAMLIVTPLYAPIPSRLAALTERLFSVSFFSHQIGHLEKPLKNKPTGIFCYGSSQIADEKSIKLVFEKILTDNYKFDEVTYKYLNEVENPNEKYGNIIEYVEDIIMKIK